MGNVFKVKNPRGQVVYITQNQNISLFSNEIKSVHSTKIFAVDEELSLLNATFSGAGVYDDVYLEARNKYLFEPATYKSMQSGITMFLNGGASEENIISGNLNLLDHIDYNELLGVVFNFSIYAWIDPFMTYLGQKTRIILI